MANGRTIRQLIGCAAAPLDSAGCYGGEQFW